MAYFTVAIIDNILCVKDVSNDLNEPKAVSCYWPCYCFSEIDRPWHESLVDREAIARFNDGLFEVKTCDGSAGYWVKLPLRDGAKTLPIRTDSEPIPCPKVRKGIEVEYRNGRWMKCLRTGWVSA